MKINEALKVIDKGWIKKKKGFRVIFQKKVGSEFITDYCPGEKENPLDSDVVAWRLAWKLAQTVVNDAGDAPESDLVNIHVVDDEGAPVRYYATNDFKMLNEEKMTRS